MKQSSRIFFVAIIITISLFTKPKVFAQTFYSIDPNYRFSKTAGNNLLFNYIADYPDTSLTGFHEFFPRNFLGNVGLPSPDYFQRYGTDELGFRFYETPYRNDRFQKTDINYFRSKGPYAELTGIAGSKQLQIFKLFFTHTYKKVNVSLRFNRYTSQGFYFRQQSFTNNFYLSSNYASKSERAGYYFYFLNNGNRHSENGGIQGDTLNEKTLIQAKDVLPVKIKNASRDNKQYSASFNPWIKLNRGNDSVNALNHYLQVKSAFNTELIQYKDQSMYTDKFYLLMYHDTTRTFDSSRVFKLSNAVDYTSKSRNGNFGFSAGYKHELNKVWQKTDSLFGNHILQSELVFKKSYNNDSLSKRIFESVLNANYILAGTNNGNYKLENRNKFQEGGSTFSLNVLYEQRSPDYIYNYWVSNHFTWFNNGYLPQEKIQMKWAYNYRERIGLSVLLNNYRNYLYFDNAASPRQYSESLQGMAVNIFATKIFFRHLGIFTDYTWQKVSNISYLRVPEHSVTARMFYTGSHFKNNLGLNIGAQLQYYTSFYGYAYMPATNIFHLQEDFKTSPYPFLDIYLNARIRPVNIFIKIENVLHRFAGTGYSFVPGYYQPDRAFRFGLSWMFFD